MPSRLTRPVTSTTSDGRRRLDPMVAVVVAAGLCGLAVGSALRADPVLPEPPRANELIGVFASFDVTGVVLDPGPVMLLDVAVHNASSERVMITDVTALPPGVSPSSVRVDRVVEPNDLVVMAARADLACGAAAVDDGVIGASVSVVPFEVVDPRASVGQTTVRAIRSGSEAGLPACLEAQRRLPRAGDTLPVAGRLTVEAHGAVVVAQGLPVGAVVYGAVIADPTPPFTRWWFGLAAAASVGDDGSVRLPLAPGTTMCRSGLPSWPTLPAGISITYRVESGTDRSDLTDSRITGNAYVGVGPDFTRWALATYDTNCPG